MCDFRSMTEGTQKANKYLVPYKSADDDRFRVSAKLEIPEHYLMAC